MKKLQIEIEVNGDRHELLTSPNRTLLQILREDLGLSGAKHGCGEGECGSCTVLLDGRPVNSCLVLAPVANGRKVTTIEGVAKGKDLHPVQQAFVDQGAIQCGYCTPGMVLSAKALLDRKKRPTEHDIRSAISGNLCRCTGYQKIVDAVHDAAKTIARTGR